MTYDEYARIEGMNFSKIKHMRVNALTFRKKMDEGDNDTANRSLLRYQHAMALEPHTVADSFAFWRGAHDAMGKGASKNKFQTSASSNCFKRFEAWARASGQSVVMCATPAQKREHDRAFRVADIIREHPDVALAMSTGQTEIEFFGFDPELGRKIKCRTDIYSPSWVLDLKDYGTTETRAVGRMAWNLGAVHQLAFNRRCMVAAGAQLPEQWGLICIDNKIGDVVRRTMDPNDLDLADLEIIEWLKTLDECERSGNWPGNGDGMLDIPAYAFAPDIDDFTFGAE